MLMCKATLRTPSWVTLPKGISLTLANGLYSSHECLLTDTIRYVCNEKELSTSPGTEVTK